MRLGIANVFSLTALMTLGASAAVFVSALRVVMAFMISGNPFALACSVGGLLCSLPLTVVLYRRFGKIFSVEAISVAAAAAFNAGQLSVVVLITGELSLFGYLPFLTLAALMTGFGVGAVARTLSARLSSLPIRTDEE